MSFDDSPVDGARRPGQGPEQLPERLRLEALDLPSGEVKQLCGCNPETLWRPSRDRRERLFFAAQELALAVALTPIVTGAIYLFAIRPLVGEVLWLAVLCPIVVAAAIASGRAWWRQRSTPQTLVALLDDLDRYRDALRAVAIAESLGEARRAPIDPAESQALRQALWLTREDLIRAFAAERILRENRDFLSLDLDRFSENLTAIQAIETDVRAREYQASIREEMRKLRG